MALSAGTKLGNFEILEPLGAGAMGEVYLALDNKLDRKVAIKVLPETFAQDQQRLTRLEREAKTLASLDHSNIGALYDFQHIDGILFLVLQLIDGESMDERISRGPIPLDEALPMFVQVAQALEAAHMQGVVHRDLKPANIKVTSDGKIKVLDFGLAKTYKEGQSSSPDDSSLDGGSHSLTQDGAILGTPTYMSPEQARAKDVDKRTDIWAFGCSLFEAITGTPPFKGQTTADLVVRILRDTPDWSLLPENTPEIVRTIIRRCLERDSRRRLKDAGDIAIALEEAQDSLELGTSLTRDSGLASIEAAEEKRDYRIPALVAVLALVLSAGIWWTTQSRSSFLPSDTIAGSESGQKSVRRFSIGLSPEYPLKRPNPVIGDNVIAISPDGETLVYVSEVDGKTQLVRRELNQLEAVPIAGSRNAWSPFFSPDGEWVAYQERGNERPKLMKIPIEGGVAVALSDSPLPFGGTWTLDGTIIFGPNLGTGLFQVPAEGGTTEVFSELQPDSGESTHGYPQEIRGAHAILYGRALMPPHADHSNINMHYTDTTDIVLIAEDVARARYATSGHVVYSRAGALLAVPFDLQQKSITGAEVPVTESRMVSDSSVPRNFAFSDDGTLVYIPVASEEESARQLVWVDRQGVEETIGAPERPYSSVRVSPDGTKLAVDYTALDDVWIYGLNSGRTQRLTFDFASDYRPMWVPNGDRVVFVSARDKDTAIYSKRADGVGEVKHLVTNSEYPYPESLSPNGKILIYAPVASMAPVFYADLDTPDEPEVLLEGKFNEQYVRFSPDGKWISYESSETGRFEIYVQPFPAMDAKWQISISGGQQAIWSPNEDELFYWENDRLMAVAIETASSFSAGDPKPLFEMPSRVSYDIAADGERFVIIKEKDESSIWASELIVVENWFEELERLAPPGNSN